MEVKIGDRIFRLEKPSGYKLLKALGDNKDPADVSRDLILAVVKEPKLSREEVENLDAETYFTLSAKITEFISDDLKKLQTLSESGKK